MTVSTRTLRNSQGNVSNGTPDILKSADPLFIADDSAAEPAGLPAWEDLAAPRVRAADHKGALFPFLPLNHKPTSTNDSVGTLEDTPKVLRLTDFGSYLDADHDPLAAVQITALASHGSLQYDGTGSGDWGRVTLDQVISASDIAAGRLRFVPGHDENGVPYATLGFRVGDGTDFSVSAYTLKVNVAAVNDAPVAHDDSATVNEGVGNTVTMNVLGNDSDVDSPLSPASITGFSQAAHGAAIYNGDGTFSYSHDGSETTSDSFTYTITDNHGAKSTATVHITVNPVNDAPVIVSSGGGTFANIAVAENTTAVTDVDATDADGGALSYSILPTAGTDFGSFTIDPTTGVLSFVAAPDFEYPTDVGGADGDDVYMVDVQASDGQGGTDTQTIAVNVQNVTTGPPHTTSDMVITNAGYGGTVYLPEGLLLLNDHLEGDQVSDPFDTFGVGFATGGVATGDFSPGMGTGGLTFLDTGTLGGSFMYGARSSTVYGDLDGELATVTIDNHTADTTVLTGGAGDDIIFSAETYFDPNNSDRLVGGGGSDWMFGNDGNDVLDGGAGDDIMHGGAGLDVLDFSDASSAMTFTLVQAQLNYWAVDLTAFGLGIDCYSNMEGVIGSAFGDTLTGSGEADLIDGGAGDDNLLGGAGNDNLIGGAGNDIFTFADGCGQDGIFDFAAGAESDDVLDITAFGFADFSAIMAATTNVNGDAVIALDADDSITLVGVTPDQLHLNDFYFL